MLTKEGVYSAVVDPKRVEESEQNIQDLNSQIQEIQEIIKQRSNEIEWKK